MFESLFLLIRYPLHIYTEACINVFLLIHALKCDQNVASMRTVTVEAEISTRTFSFCSRICSECKEPMM